MGIMAIIPTYDAPDNSVSTTQVTLLAEGISLGYITLQGRDGE